MWKRDPYSYSADVWALGCILYELCALKPLFMAREEKDIKRKVVGAEIDCAGCGWWGVLGDEGAWEL